MYASLKDARSVSFRSSETYSRKYEKRPNIVIHSCKNIKEKVPVKMSGPHIWRCLFTFRPAASNQLNSLTTIDKLSVDLVVQW